MSTDVIGERTSTVEQRMRLTDLVTASEVTIHIPRRSRLAFTAGAWPEFVRGVGQGSLISERPRITGTWRSPQTVPHVPGSRGDSGYRGCGDRQHPGPFPGRDDHQVLLSWPRQYSWVLPR
jgi:hypothetical protein